MEELFSSAFELSKVGSAGYNNGICLGQDSLKDDQLLESLSVGVSVINNEMELIRANKKLRDWFPGMDLSKKPKCFHVLQLPLRASSCDGCPVCLTLQDGEVHEAIREVTLKGENRYYLMQSTPIKSRGGTVTASVQVIHDVTDYKLNEDVSERIATDKALKQSYANLEVTLNATVSTIASIVEKRDPYTAGHQERVAQLSLAIAKEMGLSPEKCEAVFKAGKLHDIGKIFVPSDLLNKPGKLSNIEMAMIKVHPENGREVLKKIPFKCGDIAEIVAQHHERLDGSGYPLGLVKDDLMLEARILGVADVVEAMVSHRPYRPALGVNQALKEIERGSNTQYDSKVVEALLNLFNKGLDLDNLQGLLAV